MFSIEGFFFSLDEVKSNKYLVEREVPLSLNSSSLYYMLSLFCFLNALIQFFEILESWSTRLYFLNSLHPGWHPNHPTLNFEPYNIRKPMDPLLPQTPTTRPKHVWRKSSTASSLLPFLGTRLRCQNAPTQYRQLHRVQRSFVWINELLTLKNVYTCRLARLISPMGSL